MAAVSSFTATGSVHIDGILIGTKSEHGRDRWRRLVQQQQELLRQSSPRQLRLAIEARLGLTTVSVHHELQPLSAMAAWIRSAESSPVPFSQMLTWVPGTEPISFAIEPRQSIVR